MAKISLGRGLGALISEKKKTSTEQKDITEIEMKKISVSRYQPRKQFDEESLKDLSDSIKEKGVIQPIIVRPLSPGYYELIAGERRLRAAKKAGLNKIPAVIRNATDEDSLEVALIENIQRDNLNPLEEAVAYQRLANDFDLTQEQISEKVGKKRTTVTNTIRLLSLSKEIQNYIRSGHINMGHARALLSLPTPKIQIDLCLRIIAEGLSVRETERFVTETLHPDPAKKKKVRRLGRDPHVIDMEEKLQKTLGSQVIIRNRGKSGRVEIYYYSIDEFDRLVERLGAKEEL